MKELKKEIPNIKLLLVGDGDLLTEYQQTIQNDYLDDVIKLLGRRNDINEILSITDIYLASSIREGLPVNIMEAMYKGLPIIATDNRGHRELIKDNVNGNLVSNDEKEFLKQIKNILKDKEKQQVYEKNSRQLVNKYKLENVMKNMTKIYSNY